MKTICVLCSAPVLINTVMSLVKNIMKAVMKVSNVTRNIFSFMKGLESVLLVPQPVI